MKYSIEFIPYKTTPGKIDNWKELNNPKLGFPVPVKIVNSNYRVYYK